MVQSRVYTSEGSISFMSRIPLDGVEESTTGRVLLYGTQSSGSIAWIVICEAVFGVIPLVGLTVVLLLLVVDGVQLSEVPTLSTECLLTLPTATALL